MNIIVANKQKERLLESVFAGSGYKCASGSYNLEAIINTISNIEIDYLVIDETAVEDLTDSANLEKLVEIINPNKIYIYMTKEGMENFILVCTLINIGIYNFDCNLKNFNLLKDKPKNLEDATAYRNVLSSRNISRKDETINSKPLTDKEMDERLSSYLEDNKIKIKGKKKYNDFLFQLFNGFIIYPIITLLLTFLFYVYVNNINNIAGVIGGFREGLNTKIVGDFINPLFLVALLLGLFVMFMINKIYDKHIRERNGVYRKIMLLPVLINFAIFATDYYELNLLDKFIKINSSNIYLQNGVEVISFGVSILLMADYLIHNLFVKKNTLEFEKILENNYRWWEGIDVAFMIIFTIVAMAYIVLSTGFPNFSISPIIGNIYHSKCIYILAIFLSLKTIFLNFCFHVLKTKGKI